MKKNETRGEVLSPIQKMETYLDLWENQVFRYLKMCEKLLFNKYFLYCQVGVGEDGGIHQSTVSVLILFIFFEILMFVISSLKICV
jgi:hypothetical protein